MRSNRLKVAANTPRIRLAVFLPESAFTQTPYAVSVFTPSSATAVAADTSSFNITVCTDQSAFVALEADAVYHRLPNLKPDSSAMLAPPLKSFKDGIALNHTNQFVIAAQQHES